MKLNIRKLAVGLIVIGQTSHIQSVRKIIIDSRMALARVQARKRFRGNPIGAC